MLHQILNAHASLVSLQRVGVIAENVSLEASVLAGYMPCKFVLAMPFVRPSLQHPLFVLHVQNLWKIHLLLQTASALRDSL